MKRPAAGLGAAAAIVLGTSASAQPCVPGWTEGFPNAPSFDGEARAIAVFDAGGGAGPEVYITGHFRHAGSTELNGVARWTGSEWAPLGTGFSPVDSSHAGGYWLGVLDDGTGPALYAAGYFETAGGQPANGVARWDGTNWSALGEGLDDTVRMMCAYDDGTGTALYAVGLFDYSGATPVRGVARWDGSTWSPVGLGLNAGPAGYGWGYSIGVFDLGQGPRLVVGGMFNQAGGVPANNIASWDGQTWSAFGDGVYGMDVLVIGLEQFDHGNGPRLHIGGRFSLTQAVPQTARVALWTGSQWLQVGSDLSVNTSHYVNSFAVVPGPAGPTLHAGGWFAGAGWLGNVNYTARFVGGEWRAMETGMSDRVRFMIAHPDPGGSAIYAAGNFWAAGSAVANHAARWDGTAWTGFETHRGLSAPARCARVFDDGAGERVFVGGSFMAAGGRIVNGIAAWDGAAWHGVGGGVTGAPLTGVSSIEVFDAGGGPDLYVGGGFIFAGGTPCSGIARWNGVNWFPLAGGGVDGSVRAMAAHQQPGAPALFVAGHFANAGQVAAGSVARWDGSGWSALGSGLPAGGGPWSIDALAVFGDGAGFALFAGGYYMQIGGVVTEGIARWDGVQWSSIGGVRMFPLSGIARVYALRVWDDGSGPALFVGGRFLHVGGVEALNIARWRQGWNPVGHGQTGQPVTTGSTNAGGVKCFTVGPDDALWVGGDFRAAGTNGAPGPVVGVTRWDGSRWSPLPTGLSSAGTVEGMAYRQPSMFFGGSFTAAGGHTSDNFGEWRGCGCYPDCNGDGALTVQDFGCFQTKFAVHDPYADCNQDNAFNVQDFGCYQTRFVAGCP